MAENDEKVVVSEPQKGTHVVHVRGDSDSELQALFDCVLKPSKQMPLQKPFKMRNLPASFFNPPSHRQSPAPAHSRESSADSTYGGGGGGPIRVGGALTPASGVQTSTPQHFRHHSSPASLQQTFAVVQPPLSGGHAKQHSYDALSEEQGPLPHGWEQAVTSQGQIYFLNHVTQTTTWVDPRRKNQSIPISSNQAAPPMHPNSNNNNNSSNAPRPAPAPQQQPPSQASNPQSPAPSNNPLGSLANGAGGSTDQLAAIPLPEGWEQSLTDNGEVYFINHIDKITSWHDPRLPRLQNSQILKTQLAQQAHSPLGSPNAPVNQPPSQMVGAPRSPSTLARMAIDNNSLKSTTPNSPDARKKANSTPSAVTPNTTINNVINSNINSNANPANPTANTTVLELFQLQQNLQQQQMANNNNPQQPSQQLRQQFQEQQQQKLQQQIQQQQQQLRQASGGDPFLSTLPTSDLHARQESADSGLGLGGSNGSNSSNATTNSTSAANTFGAHQSAATEDFVAAMEDVEITPSENRRVRAATEANPSPEPSVMAANNDFESMDSEDLVPTIGVELPSVFLSELLGTNKMDTTWL